MLRLEQKTITQFKKAMEKFLPDYLNYDMKLPHEYSYNFEWLVGLIKWSIMWKNISYKKVDLDVQDIQVALR
ncbi:MAG: hypothetical protein ACK55Z_08245 [bacterium]|jgi:hypothetical protein